MAEVLSSGISKDDRKKVLDAARGSRLGEIARHLERVKNPNDLRLFRTFAATNWTSTLRRDQLDLVLTGIDTRLRALAVVEAASAGGSSIPEPKGPAKGAEPKEAVPQASAKTGGEKVVFPQQPMPGKPTPQAPTKPVDISSASPASVRSAVSSAASAVSAEEPPVSRERPPEPKGPAKGAAPKADVYQGSPMPRSREGR